jgi:hypothetical protein
MPAHTKRKTKFHLHLTISEHATTDGGQVQVDALCRRFALRGSALDLLAALCLG